MSRSLPALFRLADEMRRMTMMPLLEDPWRIYRLTSSPWTNFDRLRKDMTVAKIGKEGYQVSMDVDGFKPNDLTVKVVDDSLVVEGKFEENEDDHGFISRHFIRRYPLPKGYEADKAISTLSSDGVLTVSIPKPPAIGDESKQRVIPIQQTGPAELNVKENPPIEAGKENKDATQKSSK